MLKVREFSKALKYFRLNLAVGIHPDVHRVAPVLYKVKGWHIEIRRWLKYTGSLGWVVSVF